MNSEPLALPEVIVFTPDVLKDDRGWFMESWRDSWLQSHDVDARFVQENQSRSARGILRGIHYQLGHPQGKLVRVLAGEVFDVAVDLRRSSPRFGQWVGRTLSGDNRDMLWIPPGFGHGFLALSKTVDLLYRCTDYYYPEGDRSVLWCDPDIGVEWPSDDDSILLSPKDQSAPTLSGADAFD